MSSLPPCSHVNINSTPMWSASVLTEIFSCEQVEYCTRESRWIFQFWFKCKDASGRDATPALTFEQAEIDRPTARQSCCLNLQNRRERALAHPVTNMMKFNNTAQFQ